MYPNPDFLVGPGITRTTGVTHILLDEDGNDTFYGNRALTLNLATNGGLTIASNQVKVKASDMVGAGLKTGGDSAGVKLAVNTDDVGVEVNSDGGL